MAQVYGDDPRKNPWPRISLPAKTLDGIHDTVVNLKEAVELLINRRNSNGFRAVLLRELVGDADPNAQNPENPNYQIGGSTTINIGRGYDLYAYANGSFGSGETILRVPLVRKLAIPAFMIGSFFRAYTAPAASCTVTVARIASGSTLVLGTINFVAGSTIGLANTLPVVFDVGDEILFTAPNPADTTFANFAMGILGNRG